MRHPVSIIVPAYNAEATLPACLAAIQSAMQADDELIVFDDGSTDATRRSAVGAGARILGNAGPPRGPAHGRNRGAASATRNHLLFVDADVIIRPDAIDLLAAELGQGWAVAAFGSYDDRPRSRRLPALYANLRHHFVHQRGNHDATTFWSGIGMIDRGVFQSVGGFDEVLFAHPSIEDVELGMRLANGGHKIRLVPEAQGTHWKDWSLWRVWHTDIVRRALPWSRLIADGQRPQADLNLAPKERLLAIIALAALGTIVGGLFSGPVWLATLILISAYLIGIGPFLRVASKNVGLVQLTGMAALHFCYHVYASATYACVRLARGWANFLSPARPSQATASAIKGMSQITRA